MKLIKISVHRQTGNFNSFKKLGGTKHKVFI
jgi:hypothetical protein